LLFTDVTSLFYFLKIFLNLKSHNMNLCKPDSVCIILLINICIRNFFWTKRKTNSIWFTPKTTMHILI
jgi:hypothetical protein